MKGLLPWGRSDDGSEPSWLLTLADLLSLLLTFFVLLFSMNAVQYKDWESVVQTLSKELNPSRAKILETSEQAGESLGSQSAVGGNLLFLAQILGDRVAEDSFLKHVKVSLLQDRIVISVPASTGFPVKKHGLSDEAQAHIGQLSSLLAQINNKVMVAGHTSPQPVSDDGGYASNWELGLDRAREMAGLITASGYGRPISVLTYGETRFGEIDQEKPLNERYALAERVDIIILDVAKDRGTYDVF